MYIRKDIRKMIVLWVTLLVLHRGYTLVPVTTVQLGETVTIPCHLPAIETIRKEVHWYKQSAGDTLKIIWTMRESATPEFAPEFNNSRLKVNHDKHFTSLTILKTNQEDEGIYHCGFTEWRKNTEWTGTYLLVKGNTQRTSNYTVVKEKVHPGASVTLQCSVLSSSNRKTCPGGHNVFWFREANTSHPSIIYTDGNRHHECEKRSDTEQSCVYRLSKNISSSDSGTYYCAVATCGKILFGNATKQQMACEQFQKKSSSQERQDDLRQTVDSSPEGEYDLNYAALHFSGSKGTRGKKRKNELETEESVYSQVKCRM
ncbi:signal-regulatory protein beta-2-like isoform X7 [Oreochromis niloticus]|uniref:signal-regulatory protein beta-2-like isoform X7 n=1 Tax=Oreochromis niloticus TaxID=8128 RepID=UPI000DF2F37C|nr:signal-regulatory protein beta-2-like isoform X7 [Oreochromis niloticus]